MVCHEIGQKFEDGQMDTRVTLWGLGRLLIDTYYVNSAQ